MAVAIAISSFDTKTDRPSGLTATCSGSLPTGRRLTTCREATSTTATASSLPSATKRRRPSGLSAMPRGRPPTAIVDTGWPVVAERRTSRSPGSSLATIQRGVVVRCAHPPWIGSRQAQATNATTDARRAIMANPVCRRERERRRTELARPHGIQGAAAKEAGRRHARLLDLVGDCLWKMHGAAPVGLPDGIEGSRLPLVGGKELRPAVLARQCALEE